MSRFASPGDRTPQLQQFLVGVRHIWCGCQNFQHMHNNTTEVAWQTIPSDYECVSCVGATTCNRKQDCLKKTGEKDNGFCDASTDSTSRWKVDQRCYNKAEEWNILKCNEYNYLQSMSKKGQGDCRNNSKTVLHQQIKTNTTTSGNWVCSYFSRWSKKQYFLICE